MKRLILICFLSLCAMLAKSQDFEIVGVEHLPNDFSAREEMKTDHSERQCALLRIATQKITPEQRELFTFKPDLGSELVERATRNGEIWLWVSPGLKYLRVMHRDWGQYELRLTDYVARIEELHTYKIVVKGPELLPPPPPEEDKPRQQYLAFRITPVNATLEVDNQIWEVDADGSAVKFVNFGTYHYRVQAKDYHAEEGSVTVDDPNNMHKVNIALRPNFGWIEVDGTGNLQGASVYIDSDLVGKAPCRSERLKSGLHSVRIAKEMYETYSETVTVADNETTRLSPTLKSDFAEVTLKVDTDAEIWVNNEKKGTRTWSGPLGSGTYKIECKQNNHETSVTTKEITPAMNGQTILLPSPTPIYGSLNVESSPNFCKLFIDGQAMGETPKFINEILIGTHEIKISKEDYLDHTETVTIAKGELMQVRAALKEGSKYEETFMVKGVSFTMKLVEGGTFRMGAQKTSSGGQNYDSEAYDFESPVHSVTLSGYYMGETEVTQALWKAVMGSNPSHFQGDSLPVEQVSWNDVQEFIRKLNQTTGRNFRLPTEAEWEYAARAKTQTSLYNGEVIDIRGLNNSPNLDRLAWYGGNCGRNYTSSAGCDVANGYDISDWSEKQYNDSRGGTHPVGLKQPNAYGLYDMLGNVWEWCSDMYDDYKSSSQTNPNPQSTGKGYSNRVLRGGSWYNIARVCRVSNRLSNDPLSRYYSFGFRLCLPQ
ncbi:MAG: SUMF1/EgtB/PvdO family nonheme iron enzyme [Bacteroidales bacterium]|nr:SUMF1/EgtB/PvdO family nonheme iron enzyme [Bacteroidales bacterium]